MSAAEAQLIEKLASTSDLQSLFQSIDRNGDGVVSRDEFSEALKSFGIKLDPADMNAFMDVFDSDKNGRIDYVDFQKFASYSPSEFFVFFEGIYYDTIVCNELPVGHVISPETLDIKSLI